MSPKSLILFLLALLFFAAGGYIIYESVQESRTLKHAEPRTETSGPVSTTFPATTRPLSK
jgi:hypothetical protein